MDWKQIIYLLCNIIFIWALYDWIVHDIRHGKWKTIYDMAFNWDEEIEQQALYGMAFDRPVPKELYKKALKFQKEANKK